MCVVSMIIDHHYDKWRKQLPEYYPSMPGFPSVQPIPPTAQEIAEFRELLQKVREYDKRNNEPDCEMEEKKIRLQKLADEMGIKINFDD